MEHKITSKSQKDGSPWYDRHDDEWQRWWCGITSEEHLLNNKKCSVSIPKKTGRKRGSK